MFMAPKKFIGSFRIADPNALSPIPEIPNSACISPELSPGFYLDTPTSKSAKIISPSQKIPKIKKLEKGDLNFRFEKKLRKLQKASKKEQDSQPSELNSLHIYLKNKREVMKLIPQSKEKMKLSFMHLSKSPERKEGSLPSNRGSRRASVERPRIEDSHRVQDKFPDLIMKSKEIKTKLKKQLRKNDPKPKLKKLPDHHDSSTKELQNLTRALLQKKSF